MPSDTPSKSASAEERAIKVLPPIPDTPEHERCREYATRAANNFFYVFDKRMAAEDEAAMLRTAMAAQSATVAALVKALKSVEWVSMSCGTGCPSCGNPPGICGHRADCRLAAALALAAPAARAQEGKA